MTLTALRERAATWRGSDRRKPVEPLPKDCGGVVAAHDGEHPRPYLIGVNRQRIVLCSGCRAVVETLVALSQDRRGK